MKIEEIKKILEEKGVKIEIGGCGCCGSPWVTLEVDGQKIVDEEDFNINMFKDMGNKEEKQKTYTTQWHSY